MQLVFFCIGTGPVSHFIVGNELRKQPFSLYQIMAMFFYRHAPVSNLKHLDAVDHSALRCITSDPYGTRYCVL